MPRPLRPRVEQLESRVNPTSPPPYPTGNLTVTTLDDVVDGDVSSPTALIAAPGADGKISLAEAMRAADADAAADVIIFDITLVGGTVTLGGGTTDPRSFPNDPASAGVSEFVVTTPVTIRGTGQVVERGGTEPGAFRLFHVRPGGSLTLDRLELRNGLALGGSGFDGGGGAAGLGGAVFNQGELVVTNSTLTGNAAVGGAGSARGAESFQGGGGGGLGGSAAGDDGGGPNGGPGNSEGSGLDGGFGGGGGGGSSGGGFGGFGGGGGAGGFTGSGGGAGFGGGGGGGASGGSGGFGGGDGIDRFGGGGAGLGGAVFNLGGTVRIANSTLAGNTARGGLSGMSEPSGQGLGGAVFNLNGTAVVASSTLAGNAADDGGAAYNLEFPAEQGLATTATARLTLRNSVFVDSVTPDGEGVPAAEVVNRHENPQASTATLVASDPNITNQGGVRNDGGIADTSGLVTATRPVVRAALEDNGGPTRTLYPADDSEALNAGGTTAPDDGAGAPLLTDQRGAPRVSGPRLDLGAVEVQESVIDNPPPIPVLLPEPVAFTSPTGVTVRNAREGAAPQSDPFPDFDGDTRVATGDLDGDGFVDFVYAPGMGGGPRVRVVDGRTGEERLGFLAYERDFRGGVFLAVADVTGDGQLDVITSAGDGGGPHIKVFDARTGAEQASFFADSPDGRGGVSVAAGDVTGDGRADVVTGAGVNGDGRVQVIDGTKLDQLDARGRILPAAVAAEFFPYGGAFGPGLAVAVGRFDADRFADVAAGPLWRAAPQVFVRSGPALTELASFPASVGGGLDTGLRMAAADETADGLDDLVVTAGPGGGPHTEVIDPLTGRVLESFFTFDPAARTGFDVG